MLFNILFLILGTLLGFLCFSFYTLYKAKNITNNSNTLYFSDFLTSLANSLSNFDLDRLNEGVDDNDQHSSI